MEQAKVPQPELLWLSTLLLAVTAVWGWTFVVVKDAVAGYGVVSFLALRFLVATIALMVTSHRDISWKALRVGFPIGIVLASAYLFQTFGLRETSATNSGLITGLFMVFVPIFNRLFFRVQTTWAFWIVAVACLVGLLLLTGEGPTTLGRGDALTLGAAACLGLHVVLLDRYAREHGAGGLAVAQIGGAALLFGVLCPLVEPLAWPTTAVWWAVVITGLVATAIGFGVQTFVQQRLTAARTSIILMVEPVFAALFGFLLHGDRLNGLQWLGAALIIAALFFEEFAPNLRFQRRVD